MLWDNFPSKEENNRHMSYGACIFFLLLCICYLSCVVSVLFNNKYIGLNNVHTHLYMYCLTKYTQPCQVFIITFVHSKVEKEGETYPRVRVEKVTKIKLEPNSSESKLYAFYQKPMLN